MTGIIDAAFSRVRVVLVAFFVMILFGYSAFQTIPREAEPDVQAPFVIVQLPLPGISPEDGERLLVRPTEIELQTIEGIKQIDSLAFDGAAQIVVEFQATADLDQAVTDVREAIDRAKAEYPSNAEEPVVEEFNAQNQFPIVRVILHGPVSERVLHRTATSLRDRLETNNGVLDARLSGARDELLEVIIDPEILEGLNLTDAEVVNAVTANNQLVAAGTIDLDDGRYGVKVPGLVRSAADLAAIPVRVNGDNVVTIGDIARVRRTFVDSTGYVIFNGERAIGVDLSKRAGANIVETIQRTLDLTEQESKFWPPAIEYTVLGDRSIFVKDALGGLTSSVIMAIILVMIVIVAALGYRSALMVGIAIPTSFLIAFLTLYLAGYTLNMMVMFGLVLAVGMLVDGAIVIVEFADRRMSEGASRREAYMQASKRMFWPVVTSTATTLAAFVPFLFWNDTVGEFMKFLPLTLIFVLLSSLVVALIFLPVLGSVIKTPDFMKEKFGLKGKTDGPKDTPIENVDPTQLQTLTGSYSRLVKSLINKPTVTIVGVVILVMVSRLMFTIASPDVEFFIKADDEQINILVLGRGNLSELEKIQLTQEVATRFEDHPSIESLYLQTGSDLSRGPEAIAETIGLISIDLISYANRKHSQIIADELRQIVRNVPGLIVEVKPRESGPPVGKDVQIEIASPDFNAMLAAAAKVREFVDNTRLEVGGMQVPAYMDVEDSLPLPGIEWTMEVERAQAGRYGLSVAQAGGQLQFITNGLLVGTYRPDDSDEEIDIRVRYPKEKRNILALDTINVQTANGSIPISNFIKRYPKKQVDRINRRDGRRVFEVKANGNTTVAGHAVSQDKAIAHAKEWLESGALGDNVQWVMRGADEETAAAASFFIAAMSAAMFMIALILLMEFNSIYHSLLTLSAVVLSVFGVLLGIAISGQYISVIMTGTGIVALAGIVVNNNIVLIDTYQQLRRTGLSIEDAVVRTAAQRVRPVLLTTITTILGLLPMVFELNFNFAAGEIIRGNTSSDWWVLLSSAVVYGLAFSTILTLILTPVMLAAPTIYRRRFSTFMQNRSKGSSTGSGSRESDGADYQGPVSHPQPHPQSRPRQHPSAAE